MDKIQKALEKAKTKHQIASVNSASNLAPKEIFADPPLKRPIDNIHYTQTKVVEVSHKLLEENRIIAANYNNPQSSVFRMLRTQVLLKMRSNDWSTIAISSLTDGEGKSVVASNLAVAMAMELNQTVLLVDLDLRNPCISKYFNLNNEYGLKDYLEKDIKLTDVLINPSIKRLVILPGKGRVDHSAELLSSPKMAALVNDIKEQYDSRMIIFDVPPILQADDLLLAKNYFDCTLLVIEDGKNSEDDITKTIGLLVGHNIIGTVLNKSAKQPFHQNY